LEHFAGKLLTKRRFEMIRKISSVVVGALMIFSYAQTSQAALSAVDPGPYTAATGNFPLWYQDTNGRALELCLSPAVGPLGPLCTLLADPGFNPALPIAFPTNFPSESFYFAADASVSFGGGAGTLRYVAALEAAFATGPVVPGNQVTFARVRIIGNVSAAGTWIVTHPYGEEAFQVAAGGSRSIVFTHDVGFAPGVFTGALKGDIGPFLIAVDALGNPAPIVVGTETFIGDPAAAQPVTGSPFGTNFLRVQGPGGIDVTQPLFALMGKVFAGQAGLPVPLVIDRTTYGTTAGATHQIDVFAVSAPATSTLAFSPIPTPMVGDATGHFYGQDTATAPVAFTPITVSALSTVNTATSAASPLTDLVTISRAEYSLAAGTLTIDASSSDVAAPPTLSYGATPLAMTLTPPVQTVTVTGLLVPPATATVASSAGGSDTEEVIVLP
jgi:hypothetical protein